MGGLQPIHPLQRSKSSLCCTNLTLCSLQANQHKPVLPNATLNESNAAVGSERKASPGRVRHGLAKAGRNREMGGRNCRGAKLSRPRPAAAVS